MDIVDSIKVDLYGQYNNDTIHAYSYPDKITDQHRFNGPTDWLAPIADPRGLYQSVCKGGTCYIIHRHSKGYYYSCVERNIDDSRGGLEMVTIFVPSSEKASGVSILASLNDLKTQLIINKQFVDDLIRDCISGIRTTGAKTLFPHRTQDNTTGQPAVAYRSYRDEAELQDIFAFLEQEEYSNLDKLVIVKNVNVKDGSSIRKIAHPLRKCYSIQSLDDAKSSRTEISPEEDLSITYKKEGFENLVDEFKFKPEDRNRYRIYGNDVMLLSPSARNLRFSKRLFIDVKSSAVDASKLNDIEVVFDGEPVKNNAGRLYVLVKEDEIYKGHTAVLHVSAKNHIAQKKIIDLSDLKNNDSVEVKLKPEQKDVKMQFCFGDNEHELYSTPVLKVPFPKTNTMLDGLYHLPSYFYGYGASKLEGEVFRVEIPYVHPHKDERRRMPKWLKILLIVLASIIVVGGAFVGGLFVCSKFGNPINM